MGGSEWEREREREWENWTTWCIDSNGSSDTAFSREGAKVGVSRSWTVSYSFPLSFPPPNLEKRGRKKMLSFSHGSRSKKTLCRMEKLFFSLFGSSLSLPLSPFLHRFRAIFFHFQCSPGKGSRSERTERKLLEFKSWASSFSSWKNKRRGKERRGEGEKKSQTGTLN